MQFVVPTAIDLVPAMVLVVATLGLSIARRGDRMPPALLGPARLLQWLVLLCAVLSLGEAFTDLPIFELLQSFRGVLNFELAVLGGVSVTPITIGTGVGIVMVSWWLSTLARDGLASLLLSRNIGDEGSVAAIARLSQYALVGLGFAVGLQTLGIDLSAVLAAGAVFAVGFGLAMQQVAESFVSGVILLVERTIRPGDVLALEDGTLIKVQYLGIRSTVARTLDDEEVIIPNSMLVQTRVKNLRLSDTLLRVRVPVGVAYESDLRATMEALKGAASTMPTVGERAPSVLLTGFGTSSVDFEVSVWTHTPWERQRIRSQLAFAMWDALHEAGITIAFPQLDLHVDDALVQSIAGPPEEPPAT